MGGAGVGCGHGRDRSMRTIAGPTRRATTPGFARRGQRESYLCKRSARISSCNDSGAMILGCRLLSYSRHSTSISDPRLVSFMDMRKSCASAEVPVASHHHCYGRYQQQPEITFLLTGTQWSRHAHYTAPCEEVLHQSPSRDIALRANLQKSHEINQANNFSGRTWTISSPSTWRVHRRGECGQRGDATAQVGHFGMKRWSGRCRMGEPR